HGDLKTRHCRVLSLGLAGLMIHTYIFAMSEKAKPSTTRAEAWREAYKREHGLEAYRAYRAAEARRWRKRHPEEAKAKDKIRKQRYFERHPEAKERERSAQAGARRHF